MATGVIGDKIYVAGGSTGSVWITNLYIYDIASNSWSAGAPMGTGANYPAGTVVGDKLWAIGGGQPFAPISLNNTQIYDPASNSWSNGPVLNQARSFADAVTLNGAGTQSALIVGGFDSTSSTSLNSVEMNTSICGGGELTLVSAASRKNHGNAGPFDIDLPLTGTPGVECRVGNGGTFLQSHRVYLLRGGYQHLWHHDHDLRQRQQHDDQWLDCHGGTWTRYLRRL